ncbi:DegT/DnrJ/EryC1/StrS family aminotransferase [Peristeroidobacter agariperforans]|uniref:DegT/DnrJ/EryC1/StrS family aminotransferase n=1 Tax=Peristeroidobacter agariperforans TaxID=268404 RepID=UPI00101C8E17|nr:DegT/DnrJ/EryC1/StrS family aminotransferase [Peristeroidobacter agariperforans]
MSAERKIPFFNYQALFASQEQELMGVLRDVMSRGAYILQKDLLDFEASLRSFLNVKHAIGMADGTNALKLALLAVGVGPGDEVIVPAHTYIASAASIHFVGAKPVLCECGPDHMIDVDSARRVVTSKTKAIMPVQLNGRTSNMDRVMELARERGLHVIEDAAQALGSKFKGRFAGTFGAAGTFSFYPAKVLGCFGDGGGLVTNDDAVAEKVMLLRDHGRNADGEVVAWGTNSRLDNVQAAVLNFKMKTFLQDLERRRAIAAQYDAGLRDVAELVLPPPPNADDAHHDIFQNYEIEAERRDALKAHLESKGIRTIVQFGGKAVHQFAGLGFDGTKLPFTERMYTRLLLLPMNVTISDDDVAYVVQAIRAFYGRGK